MCSVLLSIPSIAACAIGSRCILGGMLKEVCLMSIVSSECEMEALMVLDDLQLYPEVGHTSCTVFHGLHNRSITVQ